ncbi:proto-oncogene tyrosine-protein kinase ROS isoform X2 [Adelges cooleyi]|uniref:proto-oncogene tyrosine-protein kinase ROS isoform X2 n=1 Tax=Adelges cooleyi TaxID=133065 RepID=UPI0021804574|nr:proto-oncogene tyrosine-protein kinase ROS isoform X2 [Adelges cooleyi]
MAPMAAINLMLVCVFVLLIVSSQSSYTGKDDTVQVECTKKCHLQKHTNSSGELLCDIQCKKNQCSKGCSLWNRALKSNCTNVCVESEIKYNMTLSELHCTAGCNDAVSLHFQNIITDDILPPPSLVPDSLTNTSLKLQWKGVKRDDFSYSVQWKLENNSGTWQYCQKQEWINNSAIIKLTELQPYTNYRFRVVLLLSWSGSLRLVVSDPSVVISTYPSKVPPSTAPKIVRATPADFSISVTWAAIPFPLAPILSYHLTIQELTKGYFAIKEFLTETENGNENFYMFRNLEPGKNYSISLAARNQYGVGPNTTTYVITTSSSIIKYTPEPVYLFLVSNHDVFYQTKELIDTPKSLYHTDQTINCVSLNTHTKVMYIADSSGRLLSVSNDKKVEVLLPHGNDIILEMSFDWLNNQMFILMSTLTNNVTTYNIYKFDIQQKNLINVALGFDKRPIQMKVDPCNGYLFWTMNNGLYRLDLSKEVSNLRKELIHMLILPNNDIGPFVIDYTNFSLLVLFRKNNTIMSVSLDGKEVLNVRKNTARSVFSKATTLVYANGLFYWSNGPKLMGEEYHEASLQYYQHVYPSFSADFHLVLSNFTDQQPVPIPTNPPRSLQAIATSTKLKAMWQAPDLLAGQGYSSWQGWSYWLSISHENKTSWKTVDVNKTEVTIDLLKPGTNYVLKVAAHSSSGQGPWSSEFVVKTLSHNVSVLWGNSERILISDIMGNYIDSIFLDEDKTEKYSSLNDIAWYEDRVYYVVSSSKINWLNLTSRQWGTVEGINSVQNIAIDWLGRKIYWSDPLKKSISRENLCGGQKEELLILSNDFVKELKVESVGGYLYWSTEYTVQSSKLNGKGHHYYTVNHFNGKIMGLAVDSVDHWVYWILREQQTSKLYRAPTAEKLSYSDLHPVKEFENLDAQDSHLMWLHSGNDIVMSDTDGQYPAIIRAMNLNGLQTFCVLDPYAHPKPKGLKTNVIPEEVDIKKIKVYPKKKYNSTVYGIDWNPVTNVNHGSVFYNVIVWEKDDNSNFTNFITNDTQVLVHNMPLQISIEASTVWGSSQVVTVFFPIPSEPTDIRLFINVSDSYQTRDVVLQYSSLQNVSYYEVFCQYCNGYRQETCQNKTVHATTTRTTWTNLSADTDYEFKVKACSTAGCSDWSQTIILNRIPVDVKYFNIAMVSGSRIFIFHSNKQNNQTVILTDSMVKCFTLSPLDDIAYWSEGDGIYSSPINMSIRNKLYTKSTNYTYIENLSVDWSSNTLFWYETSKNQSTIMSLDLKNNIPKEVIRRSYRILKFLVVPSEWMLIWVEETERPGEKIIMKSNMDGNEVQEFFCSTKLFNNNYCNCSNLDPFDDVLTLDFSNNGSFKLLWVSGEQKNIITSDMNGCLCSILKSIYSTQSVTSLAVDKHYIYWTTNNTTCLLNIQEERDQLTIENHNIRSFLNNITAVFTIGEVPESFKRPDAPGLPKVVCSQSSICTVEWDKSESTVKMFYYLDRKIVNDTRDKRILDHNWVPVYNGTSNNWRMFDVNPSLSFIFRVRAKNYFGWSDYTILKIPVESKYKIETTNIHWIVLISGLLLFVCIFSAMITSYCWVPCKTIGPLKPDVELGRLRDYAINVGYQGAVLFQKKEKGEMPVIKREQISLQKRLGSGAFGEVFEGKIKNLINGEPETRVAVKALKEGATQSEMAAFMKEAKLMNNFKHKHIVQLIGVCLDNDPNFILMELMEGRDLLSFLRRNRPTNVTKSCINLIDLLSMCIDVAEGCSYLEQMHFVHRDLACRNCLVTSSDPKNLVVKIGDFGLARNIYTHDYYRRAGESLLPVKWMSPEAVMDCVFTSQSDVWAFGVLLWEIMTMGQHPYPGLSNFKVICYVQQGGRLEKPVNCPRTLYNLMQRCWNVDPNKRPRFDFCLKVLKSCMAMPLDYVNIFEDPQLQNLSVSESYELDITYSDSYHKPSYPINNEGYEVPDTITNNEYLDLGGIEYLDLSKTTATTNLRNSVPDLRLTENATLLYCNMSTEQS